MARARISCHAFYAPVTLKLYAGPVKPFIILLMAMISLAGMPLSAQNLPNGWKLTLIGRSIPTEDLVLNTVVSPDAKAVVVVTAGFNPHGLVVVDTKTEQPVQRIALKSAYNGLAWSADGKSLYVSGG